MGLGVDTSNIPNQRMSDREKHERRWLFWVVFCQDKCHALHFGRDMRIARPKYPRTLAISNDTEDPKIALFICLKDLYMLGTAVIETMYVNGNLFASQQSFTKFPFSYCRRRVTREMVTELL